MKMKLLNHGWMILVFTALVSFCYAQEAIDYKAQIKKINDLLIEAEMNQDIGFTDKYYADDIIIMPNMGPMIKGKEAAIESEKEGWEKGYKVLAFALISTDVKACEAFVYEVGTYAIMMEIPGLDEPWADKGKYLTVWEIQEDGGLRIKVDIYNTDINPYKESKEK